MSDYYKYPRTFHFQHSKNLQKDDDYFSGLKYLNEKEVVVSLKIDGEGISLYRDYIHARSISQSDHPSRHWIKNFHATIKHEIPDGWRICGENVYALHSIYYTNLPSYFLVYGIYDENNVCLKWDDVCEFCNILNLCTVPVFYRGIFDLEEIHDIFMNYQFDIKGWTFQKDYLYNLNPILDLTHELSLYDFNDFRKMIDQGDNIEDFGDQTHEGYVVRLADSFHYNDYTNKYCAKWVRQNHVCTSEFWLNEKMIQNKLR